MLICGWRRQIFGHKRIKSLLEEANMDPWESLLQYVGGKEEGSQEAKSMLSFHPYSSKDFQMGREQSSWLKSPPIITGPGHDEVAVKLVLQIIGSLPVQQFRLFVIGLGVTID